MRDPDDAIPSAVADVAELDRLLEIASADHPGVAVPEPVVRPLHLVAPPDLLLEDPVLVPQGVADRGQRERGHGIEEARRQSAESAVPEPGVALLLLEGLELDAVAIEGRPHAGLELEVQDVVPHGPTEEELDREEADPLASRLPVPIAGVQPSLHEDLAHLRGEREEPVAVGGLVETLGALHREVTQEPRRDLVGGDPRGIVVERMLRSWLVAHADRIPLKQSEADLERRGRTTATTLEHHRSVGSGPIQEQENPRRPERRSVRAT